MAEDILSSAGDAAIPTSLPNILPGVDPLDIFKQTDTGYVPPLPNGTPTHILPNNEIAGGYLTGPSPGTQKVNPKGTLDFAKAAGTVVQNDSWAKDQYKYGRTYGYGAGYKAQNFDRYYAYGDTYKELGFSPYRDNDTHYNEKTSWWDDFNRSRGQWTDLVWSGFKSVYGSEKIANEEMEKAMSIGLSTKEGFGAWMNNFGLNTGYTIGIMAELAAENAALAAIEFGTFGAASAPVGAAAVTRNVLGFERLTKAVKGFGNLIESIKAAETAKDFWKAAKLGDKAMDFAKWVNPLANTTEAIKNLKTGAKGFESMGNLAKMSRSFGAFYKDFREINLAHSEARLEGEGALTEFQENEINKFYNKNGRMPNDEEVQDIFNRALSLKSTVTLANDATIYLTNKLVFENLFAGFRPSTNVLSLFKDNFKQTIRRTPAAMAKAGEQLLKVDKKTFIEASKDALFKSSYSPLSRKYFFGNLGEALQENAQEAITLGSLEYYRNVHSDPGQLNFYQTLSSIGQGAKGQFSAQGLDTFIQGYLMGAVVQGGSAPIMSLGERMVTSKEKRATDKQNREEYVNNVVNAANHVFSNLNLFSKGATLSDAFSEIRQAAAARKNLQDQGDTKGMHDASDMVDINYVDVLAQTGNMGLVIDSVDDYLKLDDQALKEAFDGKPDKIREKLNTFKERMEGYQNKYDEYISKNPNPYDPWQFDPEKYPDAHQEQMIKYKTHEDIRKQVLFATEDFDRITKRMNGIYQNMANSKAEVDGMVSKMSAGSLIKNTGASDIAMLIDDSRRNEYLGTLDDTIKAYSLGNSKQKKLAKELAVQKELLVEWNDLVASYLNEYTSNKRSLLTGKKKKDAIERARQKKGAIVQDKKSKETYTVISTRGSNAVVRQKNGKIKTIKRNSINVIQDVETGKPVEFEGLEGDELSIAMSQLYDQYDKYVRHVAKMNEGVVFDDKLNKGFENIRDFYALDRDLSDLVTTINILGDPTYYQNYFAIQEQVQKKLAKERQKNLIKALDESTKMQGLNKAINEIFMLGLRVLPEDVKKLKDYTVVDFYDEAGKKLLDFKDKRYIEALNILEKYAALENKMVTNKVISEAGTTEEAKEALKYFSNARNKLNTDKRSFSDIADQFGFNPTSDFTRLSTLNILRVIAESEFATPQEKRLAARLSAIIPASSEITFVKDAAMAGTFVSETKNIVIDPRYSSEDFAMGKKGNPIEFHILRQVTQLLTSDALATDAVFNDKITKLRENVIAYQRTTAYRDKFGNAKLLGSASNKDFVMDAMTNLTFQSVLAEISYESTGKTTSAWDDFVDALKTFFTNILKLPTENTLLGEAINIITSKIDEGVVTGAQTKTQPQTPGMITVDMTPQQIRNLDSSFYENELVKAYEKYADNLGKEIPEDSEDLIESQGLADFIVTPIGIDLINLYNKKKGYTVKQKAPPKAPAAPSKPSTKVSETITDEIYNDFVDNNIVSDDILNSIADKVIAGTALSPRENAIFTGKTAEINDVIRQKAAPAPAASKKIQDINNKIQILNDFIDDKYGSAYGLDPMGLPTDYQFHITEGFSKTLMTIDMLDEDLEAWLETPEDQRKDLLKTLAQKELDKLNEELKGLQITPTVTPTTPVIDVKIQIKELGDKLEKLSFDEITNLGKFLDRKAGLAFKEIEDVAHAVAYSYYMDKKADLVKAVDEILNPSTSSFAQELAELDELYDYIEESSNPSTILDEWYNSSLALLSNTNEAEKAGLTAESIEKKRQDMINKLAEMFNFTDLEHGKVVKVKGEDQNYIVYDPDGTNLKKGKEVVLLPESDFVTGDTKEAISVNKNNFKTVIQKVLNDFTSQSTADEVEITPEDFSESNDGIDLLNNLDKIDNTIIGNYVEKGSDPNVSIDDLFKDLDDSIDNCKTGK